MFLSCREGSAETVRHLLVNFANRKVADFMDMTPEDIARQRHHQDIVELLTDWSLGCNSPNAVPAPTSLHEGKKSPMVSIASLLATSPSAVEIPNGSAAAAARQKATVSRTSGSRHRPSATGNKNDNNAKRKRKAPSPYGFTRILMPCAARRQQQQ